MQHNGHVVVMSNSTRVKGGNRNSGTGGGMYGTGSAAALNPISPAYPGMGVTGGGLSSPARNAYALPGHPTHCHTLPCVYVNVPDCCTLQY